MVHSGGIKKIDLHTIVSLEAIQSELDALTIQLPGTRLENLLTFNQAYCVVAKAVKEASDNGYFRYPEFIKTFNISFAKYYFQVVNDLVDSNKVAPAWAKVTAQTSHGHRPAFISLLMGVNAHINYDLPLALLDTMDQGRQKALLKDISKIDRLLVKSGRRILDTFDEPNKLLDFIKRHFIFLYFRPAMYMILLWRIIAWRNYRALQRNRLDNQQLAVRSTKIAKRLARIRYKKSYPGV